MFSILLSLVVGAAVGTGLALSDTASVPWSVVWGFAAFVATGALVAFVVRRRISRVMSGMQEEMLAGQERLRRRLADWQAHPKGDPRRVQEQFQRDQAALVNDAIAATAALEPFRGWIPWFQKQINTTRMQLWYQVRRFDKVDELLPNCLILDPLSAALKLARQHTTGEETEELRKTYRKARARLRYNQSAFLSAAMSWILVKRGEVDEAYQLLEKACKDNNTEEEPNASLVRNRDALANNRVKQFSNAAFGDQWYALLLEEPRVRYERRAPTRFGKFG